MRRSSLAEGQVKGKLELLVCVRCCREQSPHCRMFWQARRTDLSPPEPGGLAWPPGGHPCPVPHTLPAPSRCSSPHPLAPPARAGVRCGAGVGMSCREAVSPLLAHPEGVACTPVGCVGPRLAASRTGSRRVSGSIPGGGERGAGSSSERAGVREASGAEPARMRENGWAVGGAARQLPTKNAGLVARGWNATRPCGSIPAHTMEQEQRR